MPRQRASIASAFRERKLLMEEKKELLNQDERVVEIELERLRGFVNHLFKVQTDSQMIALQESVVFPQPVGPTMAIRCPDLTERLKFSISFRSGT